MRIWRTTGICVALGLTACATDIDAEAPPSDEQELTESCSGPFKKLSELPFGADLTSFTYFTRSTRAIVDADGDGHLDYLVVREDTRGKAVLYPFVVGLFRGDGHGNLAPPLLTRFEAHAGDGFRSADFNGDGRRDLFHQGTTGYEILLQQADGSWSPPIAVALGATCKFARGGEGYVTAVSVEDEDHDGKDDLRVSLVTADASGAEHGQAFVHGTATGVGAPSCETFPSNDAFGTEWYQLRHTVRGDFDGDGKADLAGYADLRNLFASLDVYGQPSQPKRLSGSHNNQGYRAVAGRFDVDDVDDVADLTMIRVELYYGDRTSPFTRREKFEGLPAHAGMNTGDFFPGDFNGDGRTDFVWFDYNERVIDGSRLTPTVCSTAQGHRRYVTRLPLDDLHANVVGVGDFDEDGKDDLLVSTFDDHFQASRVTTTSNPSRLIVYKK